MCAECDTLLSGSFYEHMNSCKRYHAVCFAKLAALNRAFALLCKLRF